VKGAQEREDSARAREDAARDKEDAAQAREDAAQETEDRAQLREDASQHREYAAQEKREAAREKEDAAQEKDNAAQEKNDAARDREKAAKERKKAARVREGAAREQIFYGRPRPSYLVRELLGSNRIDGRYLFVTDGGHYENLGLVELLRRGCTQIYCFDASSDSKFSVLGDAIALARSELGVEVNIDPRELEPRRQQEGAVAGRDGSMALAGAPPGSSVARDNVASGTIDYRNGRTGLLIYARCVMTAKAPWDIVAHQYEDPTFPHNSTVDQLYTDQKFESYRALGALAGRSALEQMSEARTEIVTDLSSGSR
jgi:hypothetical protein